MDLSQYFTVTGFYTKTANEGASPGQGNGWLDTGVFFALYPLYYIAQAAFVIPTMFDACRKAPDCPLIYRSPYKKNADDNESEEDYLGALLLAKRFRRAWAAEILLWARAHNWEFDVQQPDVGFWQGLRWNFARFLSFAPMVYACSIGMPWWLVPQSVVFLIFSAIFNGAADGNAKVICFIAGTEESRACQWAARFWEWRAKRRYGSVVNSVKGYFPEGNPVFYIQD